MALYNVTYELKGMDADYASFFNALKNEAAYNQCLKTSWFIVSNKDRNDLYSYLKSFLRNSDLLLISETHLEQLSGWLPSDSVEWLTNYKTI